MADKYALAYLKSNGHLIYLKVDPETVYERLQDSHYRPLLMTAGSGELNSKGAVMERIETLLRQREPFYLDAHETIDTEGKSPEAVADEIQTRLRRDG